MQALSDLVKAAEFSYRKSNFVKRDDEDAKVLLELPYDYGSVMHYKTTTFSKYRGSSTLVPSAKEAVKVMGQRAGMTRGDIAKVNRLYNCTGGYYRGEDLEGKSFLLGKFHKINAFVVPDSSEEDLDFGKDARNEKKTHGNVIKVESKIRKEDAIMTEANNSFVKNKSKNGVEDSNYYVSKQTSPKPSSPDWGMRQEKDEMGTNNLVLKYSLSSIFLTNATGSVADNETKFRAVSEDSSFVSKEMPVILEARETGNEYYLRIKRETSNIKSPRETKNEGTEQQKGENHESFAPQKILPELLKGVLNTDNDRPIVIQFAIYQPIVYKSNNKSESSEREQKDLGVTKEDKNKDSRSRVNNEKELDNRNREIEEDNKTDRSETNLQRNTNFDENQDDGSRPSFTNRNTFVETNGKQYPFHSERIDVRTVNKEVSDPHETDWNHNERAFKPQAQPKTSVEEQIADHKTDYFPLSENHKVTVSKKDFIFSSDSHDNGEDFRVSQTDYKIERKGSQQPTDTLRQTGQNPPADVVDLNPGSQEYLTSDLEHPEETYHHDEKVFTASSPEKDYIQPLKVSQRNDGYQSSSLIHFNEGKGTKSIEDRPDGFNNNNRGQVHSSAHSFHDEYPKNHQTSSNKKSAAKEDYDVAPNFHEAITDDEDSREPKILPTFESTLRDDVSEHKFDNPLSSERAADRESYNDRAYDEEESSVDDSKSTKNLDVVRSKIRDNLREFVLEKTFVEKDKDDSIRDENRSSFRQKDNSRNIVSQGASKSRNEETYPEKRLRSQEVVTKNEERSPGGPKKRIRPDIVTDDDLSKSLDKEVRTRKTERNNLKTHDTMIEQSQKQEQPILQTKTRDQNRSQNSMRNVVVRKKIPNSRLDVQEQEDEPYEEDLVSKPKTSKLNLNPRQALPLKTSVSLERTGVSN